MASKKKIESAQRHRHPKAAPQKSAKARRQVSTARIEHAGDSHGKGGVDAQWTSSARENGKAGCHYRSRKTKEDRGQVGLKLDGGGRGEISTGVPFLDHMLDSFARHGFFDLKIEAKGDLHIDEHHTVEDVASCSEKLSHRRSANPPGI